jgi:2-iminobutanoate/2-iminopropanoate deaminase
MHTYLNPATLQKSGNFSHGVLAEGPFRWLSVAGQVARDVNGVMPDGIEAQADLAWSNVFAVLREAGMEAADILEVNVYLINRADNAGFDKVRGKWLGNAKPASTKVYVSGLADPKLLCEVQVRAAKPV